MSISSLCQTYDQNTTSLFGIEPKHRLDIAVDLDITIPE